MRGRMASLIQGQILPPEEFRLTGRQGRKMIMLVSSAPIQREDKVVGCAARFTDLTVHRQAQEQLRKPSQAVEQSPATVVITGLKRIIEYVNPKFCQITGYTREDTLGENPRILKNGLMPAEIYRQMWEDLTTQGERRGELLNRNKNGELYWEFASTSTIRDQRRRTTHFLAVKEDVAARKLAEEAALRETAKLKAMISGMEEGVVFSDRQGMMVKVND